MQKIDPDFNPVKIDQLISFKSGSIHSLFNALDPLPEKRDIKTAQSTNSVNEAVVETDTESKMINIYSSSDNNTSSGYSSDSPQRSFSVNEDLEHYSSKGFSLSSLESSEFAREQSPADYTLPTIQVCLNFPTDDVFV